MRYKDKVTLITGARIGVVGGRARDTQRPSVGSASMSFAAACVPHQSHVKRNEHMHVTFVCALAAPMSCRTVVHIRPDVDSVSS